MRKLPEYLENPIDNLIHKGLHPTTTFLKKFNMTPNGITTLSLVFGLLAVVCLMLGKVWLTVIFYFISYYWDSCDGFYARRYNMCSQGGDMYDHIKDVTVFGLLLAVFFFRNYRKLSRKQLIIVIGIIVFFTVAMSVQMMAQETYHGKAQDSPFLNAFNFMTDKEQAERVMKVTRFFGCGSFNLALILIILVVELNMNDK
jgi:phosphatidylglycerophosphate synthase